MAIKIGTDFSGIGSPESALKILGLDIEEVFACEIDKYARKSFTELHEPKTFYDDITTRNHSEVPQLDLYVAGFPCQSFSLAGKRGGFEDTRGTLFFNVAEFIKENQPKCFVLENVKGLLSHDKGRTYQTITDVLTNGGGTLNGQIGLDSIDTGLGYHVYTQVLNTKDYGIPQNRERIFIVGFKEFREFRFPKKMELKLRLKDILQDNPNYIKLFDDYNSKFVNNDVMGTLTCNSGSASERNGFKIVVADEDVEPVQLGQSEQTFAHKSGTIIGKKGQSAFTIRAANPNGVQVDEKYHLSEKAKDKIKRHKNTSLDNDVSNTIHAGYYKQGGRDQQYIPIEEKYYLSDKRANTIIGSDRSIGFTNPDEKKVANCLIAGYNKIPTDGEYLEVEEKYYLSDKMVESFQKHNKHHKEKGTGFTWTPKTGDEISSCLRAHTPDCPTDTTIIETDNRRVNECFEKHKNDLESGDLMDSYNKTIHKEVAPTITTRVSASSSTHIYEEKNKPSEDPDNEKDVEWVADYRNDEGLRVRKDGNSPCLTARRVSENDISTMPPIIKVSKEVRTQESKDIRKETGTNDFRGKEIEFREQECMNTITTALTNDHYLKLNKRIRRLTPLECWRLQGYTDQQFYKAQKVNSDTQLYKQAGNSITVNVMVELFKKIFTN